MTACGPFSRTARFNCFTRLALKPSLRAISAMVYLLFYTGGAFFPRDS